jgi:hypothetical protein
LLIRAIETQNAAILPRLIEPLKFRKCPSCPFNDMCYDTEGETREAAAMAAEKDLLDISGVVDYKPFTQNE